MKGFTLVEILVSVLILGFLFAAIYGVLNIGNIIFKDDITLVQLQQQVRQGMDAMVNEVRESKSSEVTTADGNTKITFNIVPEVYGNPWVGPISYYRDVNDTNNDGVVNQIIREYPAGTRKILANDITALSFSITGDVVEIQLAAKLAARGRELCFPVLYCNDTSKTLKEKVKLRNE